MHAQSCFFHSSMASSTKELTENAFSNCRNIAPYKEIGLLEWDDGSQNFDWKLTNSGFCDMQWKYGQKSLEMLPNCHNFNFLYEIDAVKKDSNMRFWTRSRNTVISAHVQPKQELIRRWDSERELFLQHCTCRGQRLRPLNEFIISTKHLRYLPTHQTDF